MGAMFCKYGKATAFFLLCITVGVLVTTILWTRKPVLAFEFQRDNFVFIAKVVTNVSKTISNISKSQESGVQNECPVSFLQKPSPRYKQMRALSRNRSVPFQLNPKQIFTEKVVIMTPISNARDQLPNYFNIICRLNYPHHLISIALAEDSSKDDTFQRALESLERLQKHFARVALFTRKDKLQYRQAGARHEMGWQQTRRSHLAKSRNSLVSRGLANETWVLWMDSDVQYIPPDLIQQLLAAEKDIVVPSCMYIDGAKVDIYDKNTWKETDIAREYLKDKGDKFLMLEGYGPAMRTYLNKLKGKGKVVEIDGVGGCVLLVKAKLHRNGLVFPPYIYKNHIETEGLAKMAQDMGFKIYGLPYLEVFHS